MYFRKGSFFFKKTTARDKISVFGFADDDDGLSLSQFGPLELSFRGARSLFVLVFGSSAWILRGVNYFGGDAAQSQEEEAQKTQWGRPIWDSSNAHFQHY
ncbi:unnamed protein product [Caenorhabditis nigoni]